MQTEQNPKQIKTREIRMYFFGSMLVFTALLSLFMFNRMSLTLRVLLTDLGGDSRSFPVEYLLYAYNLALALFGIWLAVRPPKFFRRLLHSSALRDRVFAACLIALPVMLDAVFIVLVTNQIYSIIDNLLTGS